MKKMERIWAIVALAALLANALPLAAAAPPPPGTVVISNVNVNRNSLSGTVANLSWSTNPTSSCDSVTYQVSGQSSHTITLPCKVHSVSLTGLAVHVTTTFTITATAKKYNPGTYSSSFYPTDVSTSKAYESFQYSLPITGGPCGTIYYQETVTAQMPGDIEYDPTQAGNANHYELFDVHMAFNGLGVPICPGSSQVITARQTFMRIWVLDTTSNVNNWLPAAVDPVPNVDTGGYPGYINWAINLGGTVYGASFGVTLGYTPPSGVTIYPTWWNTPYPDGWQYESSLEIDWNGAMQTLANVAWPLHVIDSQAQYRLGDQVLVRVGFVTTLNVWDPSYGWIGNDLQWGVPGIVMGQGSDNNGGNNLDQYTDVQMGTSSGPGS